DQAAPARPSSGGRPKPRNSKADQRPAAWALPERIGGGKSSSADVVESAAERDWMGRGPRGMLAGTWPALCGGKWRMLARREPAGQIRVGNRLPGGAFGAAFWGRSGLTFSTYHHAFFGLGRSG